MDHQSEPDPTAAAVRALRAAGYPLVLEQVRFGQLRCDVVAYAPGRRSGDIVPMAVVELKRSLTSKTRLPALEQFAAIRNQAGTRQHYLYDGQRWFAANSGLTELYEVVGPLNNEADGPATVTDEHLVESLLLRQLKAMSGARFDAGEQLQDLLAAFAETGQLMADGQPVSVPRALRWSAAKRVTMRVLSAERHFDSTTHPVVASAMSELLAEKGNTYLDPFCGTASLLWALADRVSDRMPPPRITGVEVNATTAGIARALTDLAPATVELLTGDAFRVLAPTYAGAPLDDRSAAPLIGVDAVLTQPPMGLRLNEPYELSSGEATRDGDLACLDLCLRALAPGGRGVLQTSRGWTSKSGQAQRYRAHLAAHHHVAALVGLPAGAVLGAQIPSLLVVIDKATRGQTFVAQLDQDWQEQLAPDGPALRALLEHLEVWSQS